MKHRSNTLLTEFIKVICEKCLTSGEELCEICSGARFYLWNPKTGDCLSAEGLPIIITVDNVKKMLSRQTPVTENRLEVESMLAACGAWASQNSLRRFKLWYEDRWHAYIWPNRLKPKIFEFSDIDAAVCIRKCYDILFHLNEIDKTN